MCHFLKMKKCTSCLSSSTSKLQKHTLCILASPLSNQSGAYLSLASFGCHPKKKWGRKKQTEEDCSCLVKGPFENTMEGGWFGVSVSHAICWSVNHLLEWGKAAMQKRRGKTGGFLSPRFIAHCPTTTYSRQYCPPHFSVMSLEVFPDSFYRAAAPLNSQPPKECEVDMEEA